MEKQRRKYVSQFFNQSFDAGCSVQVKLAGSFCLQKEAFTTQYNIIRQINGIFNDG